MKKITVFMFTILILIAMPLTAFANDNRVVDDAALLTTQEQAELNERFAQIYNEYQFDIVVVTTNSFDGKSVVEYADDYYDYNGYGYGDSHDGCILVINMTTRDWYISTTGYGITVLTDYGIQYVGDEMLDDLKSGDYYGAFSTYADVVERFIVQANKGEPYDVNNKPHNNASAVLAAFVAALVIALIATFSVKSSYKPVKFNRNATNYLVDGSLRLNQSEDNFLYSSVSRVKIESDSSSGGGGSSTHTGSSGTSHGGGGGKF